MRIELADQRDQAVQVEMSHDRFRQTQHAVGEEVCVTASDSRVFVADYCI